LFTIGPKPKKKSHIATEASRARRNARLSETRSYTYIGKRSSRPRSRRSTARQPRLISVPRRQVGLNLRHVVVAEVDVSDVGGGLVVAGDIGQRGDGVLLGHDAQRQGGDERQRLPALVAHQAHGALVHHPPQRHQELVALVLHAREVVLQVRLQLAVLHVDVGEVDEEARAHVALHPLHLRLGRRPEAAHQQVAVLEEPAAADLLRVAGGDRPGAQVAQGLLEVPVHALALHRRVEALGHGPLRAAVEEQQRVQRDLEGVDAELEGPPQGVHELQLHVLAGVVGQRDEAPAVRLFADLHQLLHVRLLQGDGADPLPANAFGQEVHQAAQNHVLHHAEGFVVGQTQAKDQVQVLVAEAVVLVEHVARRGAVELHVGHRHAPLLQSSPDDLVMTQTGR